jgi:hypothetical protein
VFQLLDNWSDPVREVARQDGHAGRGRLRVTPDKSEGGEETYFTDR